MSRLRSSKLIASAAVLAAASAAHAQVFFADSASNYVAGSGTSGFQNPNAALGKPVDETGFGMLTPFNSAFSGDHIVGMGPGDGTITLHLAKTASPTGNSLGIHAATGIIDNDWPNGQAGNPATPFTNPRVANVQVSYDGNTWVDLATHTFESPTNYYAQGITTPGFQSTPGTVEADWAKPFTQPLSAFNGQNWSQMLTTLNGSAGGTWLAISAPSLPGINYVKLSTPASASYPMFVDSVAGNTENIVVNAGSTMSVSAPISESTYGTLVLNSGTFRITSDTSVLGTNPSSGFINRGTLRKAPTVTTGSAVINAPVSSGGAANIDVEGGILILAGRFITTPGSTTTKTGPGFLTISGQQFHSGSFIASAGSTQFDSDATNLALVANSTVSFGSSQHLLSLRVGAGATTTLNPNGNRVLVTQTISLEPSAKLDLKDNDLIVNQGNFTQIRTDVLAGFGNNPGITSSTSDGSQVLALFDNSLVGAADFNGEPIGATSDVGKYTYFGDANIDGQVTGDDYTVIDANLNTDPPAGLEWLSGDTNLDGTVTGDDYTVIDANLGLGAGMPLAPSQMISAIPEPTCIAALGFVTFFSTRRRRP